MSENAEDAYEGDNVPDVRRKLPVERKSITHKFTITGFEAGYVTAGMYEDGTVGEIFLNGIGKEGSTLFGMAQWAVVEFSIALQFGAPLEMMCLKLAHMKFEPRGKIIIENEDGTIDKDWPIDACNSIPGYIAEWLAYRYGEKHGFPDLFDRMQDIRRSLVAL